MHIQAVLFYLSIFVASACTKNGKTFTDNSGNLNMEDSTKTYLALGDSYTIGESVSEQERFPAQITALLKESSIDIQHPLYIATTGWTTLDLLQGINSRQLTPPYSVVSLLIGVNDQYQGMDTAGYRIRFTELLVKAISLAGEIKNHVFVLSIPDYSVTPFAAQSDTVYIRKEIDAYNAINKEVTLTHGVSYTDITSLTRDAGTDKSLLATDGLHPSGKDYGRWAALVAPKMHIVLTE